MIEFANLWVFSLILAPLLVAYFVPAHKERHDSLQVPFFNRLVGLSGETPRRGSTVMRRRRIQGVMLVIGWLCLIVAAAKPEWVGEPVEIEKSARDLMIAVDLSGSMQAEDFKTAEGKLINRLDAAKTVLNDFVQQREGDRLGLIVFGDAPYLQTTFTDDVETWSALLNETQIAMAGQSTVFGDAIGLAISVFQGSDTQNRVLIVLTDGNDTGSRVPPVEAARVAQANGVRIYTIAMGDPATTGEEALQVEVLQQVANTTGGAYFEALDREALAGAYAAIDELEPELYESLSYRPRQSVYHYPLGLFASIYLIALPLLAVCGALLRRRSLHV